MRDPCCQAVAGKRPTLPGSGLRGLRPDHPFRSRRRALALLVTSLAAAVVSTAVQVVLWWVFVPAWPQIFFRDARFAAAIVLGREVLPPPATFDPKVVAVATAVHLALSLLYATLVVLLLRGRTLAVRLVEAAVFGLAIYAINMYLMSSIYPWFAQSRDWITATAHAAFGIAAALAWYDLNGRRA